MDEFTYALPNEQAFYTALKTVVLTLSKSHQIKIQLEDILDDGYCEILNTNQYSYKRWNAIGVNISIFISLEKYNKYSDDLLSVKTLLLQACKQILPPNAGFDILDLSISPQLSSSLQIDAIEEINKSISDNDFLELNHDLIEKGRKMAKAYITLYALENHLREFIHRRLVEHIGETYIDAMPNKMRNNINLRKQQETDNKWLSLRGNNELYYIDFNELADLIVYKWEYFNDVIPDQQWIKVKIDEIYRIRCLIAHNSYLSEDNLELLNVTTKQILKQLSC